MGVLPATVSAVAATLAAVLAGLNIYLNRQSENVKWARATLVETFTEFIDASFESTTAVKTAARLDPASPEIARLRAEAERAESRMRTLQTRMRLLTTTELVNAAETLRYAVRDHIATLDDLAAVTAESDKALRDDLWRHRQNFVAAVKKVLLT